MLAPFALLSPSRHLRNRLVVAGLLAALAALNGTAALGADTLPVGTLDARSTGSVSNADVAERGGLVTGLAVEANEAVVPGGSLSQSASESDEGGRPLLRDANRASVFFGSSLSNRLEATLGLHGSFEHVKPEDRDTLFPESASAASDLAWRQSVKQSGFAGASLFLKFKLLDWSGLRLAVAPFLESGAGDQATYSLTRSVGPKAGFMTIATYGEDGVAAVSLNAGARYRDPEALGDVTIRNEQFAKASITAWASRAFAFFVAGEGRRLMVADEGALDIDTGKRIYAAKESGDVKGGFTVKLGETDLTAFGGGKPKNAGGFGFGKTTYGLAVAMPLGNYRGASRKSIGAEIEKAEDVKSAEKAKAAQAAQAKEQGAAKGDDYPEMIGADIDPLEVLGTDDAPDFKDVPSRQKQYEADAKVESSDAKVERELKALKAAEEKATKEREAIEKTERAQKRLEAAKRQKKDDELMREYMDEAQKDADKLNSIDKDEMEWNGLE